MKERVKAAFLWSSNKLPSLYQVVVSFFAMTCPIVIGVIIKHPSLGILSSLGGMALSSITPPNKLSKHLKNIIFNIFASTLGFFLGNCIQIKSAIALLIVPIAFFIVAMLGGISRKVARLSAVFMLFFAVATNFSGIAVNPIIKTTFFLIGGVFELIFALILWPFHNVWVNNHFVTSVPEYSASRLLKRWIKNLSTINGWQYAIRISICSLISIALIYVVPFTHSSWILLTMCIVVQRNIKNVPTKMLQRSLGTVIGIVILGIIYLIKIGPVIIIILVSILIVLRAILKEANYLLYSTVMTQLVVIFVDFGKDISLSIMGYRLISTILGCVVSIVFGYLVWIKLIRERNKRNASISI